MSIARHHADWLNLVPASGPFVSMPVLMRAFPQGLEPRDPEQARRLRDAFEEWQDNPAAPGRHHAWIRHVLTGVLDYPEDLLLEGQSIPVGLTADIAVQCETLRPDLVLVGPAGTEAAGQARLLIAVYPADQSLERPVAGKHWKATPATRMMELLHAADVPLGLVTNGEQWMLVYAPRGETTGYASWQASLWLEEHITLRAFHSLLGVRRFLGVAPDSTLSALLKASAEDQQEVTDQLGYQVREAVEVLVQSFDALDRESGRKLLEGVSETALYDAALTVMMRLVFLFSAEERGLLHLGKPLYDENYAVSTLQEQLQETADRYGEEVLERRFDAWARLLAAFRAVHGGIRHQDLLLPAYGGSLFDPDRFPFLEGRPAGSAWRSAPAEPLAVNNRVVLHLLSALQRLQVRVPGGGAAESRRISFSALGVEQIGHVYEGLLDHTAVRAAELVLGIQGTRKKEPEISISTLESLLAKGRNVLIEYLKEETGRSVAALRKGLDEAALLEEHRLLIACGQDAALAARVRPFAGILREDSFGHLLVILPGSVYVTAGSDRRSTGTHYTPPSLTEPIVQYTLEALVYEGPAEGKPRDQWQLKSPRELLALKVCDMAMGSGAFLVQVCRYLSERLVEAWENEEKQHPGGVLITPEGDFSEGLPSERLIPRDPAERLAIARRYVADRCLYGVDINPMAVEMAKLSLWLITVDRDRPFTFLNHALKCGDSLLGVTFFKQIENFRLRPDFSQTTLATANLFRYVDEAANKRRALEELPSNDANQIEAKNSLYAEAEAATTKVKAIADILVALELRGLNGAAFDAARNDEGEQIQWHLKQDADAELRGERLVQRELVRYAREQLGTRRPFHWAIEFPEVFAQGGFDAFVGNPPFQGGKKISGVMSTDYRDYLVDHLAGGLRGSADLCAYFFLRAAMLLRDKGMTGLLATNTIAQGDTREVGLEQVVKSGFAIPRAIASRKWPGAANLEVAHVWLRKGEWKGGHVLEDKPVPGITPFLVIPGKVTGTPYRLAANANKSFQGSIVLGMGFIMSPEEALALIAKNPHNRDVLYPYLNGEDLNSRWDQSPSRWVINFHDWPLDRSAGGSWMKADEKARTKYLQDGRVPADYPDRVAADYPDCLTIVEEKVKPERQRKKQNGEYVLRRPLPQKWWIYADKRPALYATIEGMGRVLAGVFHTKYWSVAVSNIEEVFSHALVVFSLVPQNYFLLLESSIFGVWVIEFSGSLETRLRFSPSDCFETFPFPEPLKDWLPGPTTLREANPAGQPPSAAIQLETIGRDYYHLRQSIMTKHQEGLTTTYNRFHNPDETNADIQRLRELHIEMDRAVADAYGWRDLDLGHDFHETKQGVRFTVSEPARREILDRLLALNHERYAEEVAQGLHDKGAAKAKKNTAPKSPRKQSDGGQEELF